MTPHPGELLVRAFLEPLNMTPHELAVRMHVSELEVRSFIAGNVPVSFAFAQALARALHTSPVLWIRSQQNYDDSRGAA